MQTFSISLKALFLVLIVASDCLATAKADETEKPAPACESSPEFSAFDFWVGEWNVFSHDDARKFLGTNSITKHYGSCLLKEKWRGASGGSGFSINYFNPVENEWRQVWIADGYSIDYVGGVNADGAMVLTGKIYNYTSNAAQPFRGIWTPQADGSVIQHFDIFDADAESWNVWFEGLYVKK